MCKLCDKIWDSVEQYTNTCEYPHEEEVALIKEKKFHNQVWLYVPITNDYYSSTVIQCKYCPKCGRGLKNKQ